MKNLEYPHLENATETLESLARFSRVSKGWQPRFSPSSTRHHPESRSNSICKSPVCSRGHFQPRHIPNADESTQLLTCSRYRARQRPRPRFLRWNSSRHTAGIPSSAPAISATSCDNIFTLDPIHSNLSLFNPSLVKRIEKLHPEVRHVADIARDKHHAVPQGGGGDL